MKAPHHNSPPNSPPKWVNKVLSWICEPEMLEGILGDLEEMFAERVDNQGLKKARMWYAIDAIGFLRPFSWKKIEFPYSIDNQIAMLINYFKIAIRNLRKYPSHTAINLMGLTMGITGCLLIGLFVWDEWQYDNYHSEGDHIYRVYNTVSRLNGESPIALVPPTYGPTMTQDFPEIVSSLRVMNVYGKVLFEVGDRKILEPEGLYAPSSFFDFFEFKGLYGDLEHALDEPNSVVINETLSHKFFGNKNPIGETIKVDGGEKMITGVVKNLDSHFHLQKDYFISFEALKNHVSEDRMNSWVWQQFYTYLKLKPGIEPEGLEAKFPAFVSKYAYPQTEPKGFTYLPHLQKLRDIHLYSSDFQWDIAQRGNITYVWALTFIGIFLLVIACINFINLSTARATHRAKEVGIRKVTGALRSQIIIQFISEAVLLATLAAILAIGFSRSLLPYLNEFSGKAIPFIPKTSLTVLFGILASSIGIGIIAGSYPAFVISKFRPAQVLKGSYLSVSKAQWLRKGLVVLQFSLAILLIISTFIIYQQVTYINQKDLGFNQEYILTFPMKGAVKQNPAQAKAEFLRQPGIISATAGYGFPGDIIAGDNIIVPAEDKTYSANLFTIDHDYISAMGMEIVAGRDFSMDFPTDANEAFILNETAVRNLGLGTPEEVIGQRLDWDLWGEDGLKKGRVIGVVKDFHFKSLHEKVNTAVLHIYPQGYWQMALRVQGQNLRETLDEVEKIWDGFNTGYPFDYQFIDKSFGAMYTSEEKLSTLIAIFALLTIIISCMGLLGLVSFSTERRTKEIGIRKVLGASTQNIVVLLTSDLLKLVAVGMLIGGPLAWYIMDNWLSSFPYRISISIWFFVLAGGLTILLALLTVSFQSIRAALQNPVHSLRNE